MPSLALSSASDQMLPGGSSQRNDHLLQARARLLGEPGAGFSRPSERPRRARAHWMLGPWPAILVGQRGLGCAVRVCLVMGDGVHRNIDLALARARSCPNNNILIICRCHQRRRRDAQAAFQFSGRCLSPRRLLLSGACAHVRGGGALPRLPREARGRDGGAPARQLAAQGALALHLGRRARAPPQDRRCGRRRARTQSALLDHEFLHQGGEQPRIRVLAPGCVLLGSQQGRRS